MYLSELRTTNNTNKDFRVQNQYYRQIKRHLTFISKNKKTLIHIHAALCQESRNTLKKHLFHRVQQLPILN